MVLVQFNPRLFIALFIITTVFYAPFQQFEMERQARIQAEMERDTYKNEMTINKNRADEAWERATRLSDALAMNKGGETDQSKEIKTLEKEITILKATSLAIDYDDEWHPLTDNEIADWHLALSGSHIISISVYWGQDVQAKKLFKSLQTLGALLEAPVRAELGHADQANQIEIDASQHDLAASVLEKLLCAKYPDVAIVTQYRTYAGQDKDSGKIGIFIGEKLPPKQPLPTSDKHPSAP
jgi:hypothetical protein